MTAYIHKELENVLNHCMQETTSRFAGIQLLEQNGSLSDDICTVYTVLEGNCPAALLLRADTPLLTRLAQKIMHSETVSQQDIEDVATEYFNVICGRVVAGLFQTAKISSRFQTPCFRTGCYFPEDGSTCRCVLNYTDGGGENMQLVYMKLHISQSLRPAAAC